MGTLVKYMIDIAMGMHYIAQKGLIHRVNDIAQCPLYGAIVVYRIWQLVMF